MGLLDVVRSGVALANSVTADLQAQVIHRVFFHADGAGKSFYLNSPRPAIVVRKQRLVRSSSGEMVMSQAQVTFLDPVVQVAIDDQIILPGEDVAAAGHPILNTSGFVDRGTGDPILTEVFLG